MHFSKLLFIYLFVALPIYAGKSSSGTSVSISFGGGNSSSNSSSSSSSKSSSSDDTSSSRSSSSRSASVTFGGSKDTSKPSETSTSSESTSKPTSSKSTSKPGISVSFDVKTGKSVPIQKDTPSKPVAWYSFKFGNGSQKTIAEAVEKEKDKRAEEIKKLADEIKQHNAAMYKISGQSHKFHYRDIARAQLYGHYRSNPYSHLINPLPPVFDNHADVFGYQHFDSNPAHANFIPAIPVYVGFVATFGGGTIELASISAGIGIVGAYVGIQLWQDSKHKESERYFDSRHKSTERYFNPGCTFAEQKPSEKKPEEKPQQKPEEKPKDKKEDAQVPGRPTTKVGFELPRNSAGNKEVHPETNQRGYWDKRDIMWVPTGPGKLAHGGPHWDLVDKRGNHVGNVYPDGHFRGKK